MSAATASKLQQSAQVVVLKIGGLRLMLPQGDVRTLESAGDVTPIDPPENGVGWIEYKGQRWPVFCPSDELALLVSVPVTRRACVLLAVESGYVGILCDDASILAHLSAERHEVPSAMRLPGSPICALVMLEDGLACFSNAGLLTSFLAAHAAPAVLMQ